MSLMYPIRHVFRNWKLFVALLIGITLAATFFAGIWVKSDVAADRAFDKHLGSLRVDMTFQYEFNHTNVPLVMKDVLNVDGVKSVDPLFRSYQNLGFPADNYTNCLVSIPIVSFPNNSRIYDEWLNKPVDRMPENYTYIIAGTQLANRTTIGDLITTQMTFYQPKYGNYSTFDVNFTVAGFAELTDDGYAYCSGNVYGPISDYGSSYRSDMLIIDWETTLMKMWTSTLDECGTTSITFIIDVNREDIVSPHNIQESITKANRISDTISNRVLGNYLSWAWVNNNLSNELSQYTYNSERMLNGFVMVSIPIFFVAWYLGYTVSDVSFNIRRREIGLLSTKGLSSGQIQRMFLTEALVIGVLGGVLGIVGGLLLNQYYLGTVDVARVFSSGLLNPLVALATLVFAVVLAVAAVFLSARKASKIAAVDALRNYMPPSKPSRKIFPIIALILGGYKIAIFLLGVNVQYLFNQWSFGGNMFVSVLTGPVIMFDMVMTYIGPLLFFWGFTKLVIHDSSKFQVVAKLSSVTGELGALAAKNVRRNPVRLASIAFLIALIIGLSVQVTGQIASQEDYVVRTVRNDVGADITVMVANVTRSQEILGNITQNVSGIRNATIEGSLNAFAVGDRDSWMSVRTIEPTVWDECAYYEDGWFSGGPSVDHMLTELKASNNTIILDRSVAKQLDLKLYDEVTVDFASCARQLKIVGFFGPEPQDTSNSYSFYNGVRVLYSPFYSYVPRNLFNMTEGSEIYTLEGWNAKILISLQPGVNGSEVANQIRNLYLDVYSVRSFDEEWQRSVEMDNLNTFSELQILDLQSFGLIFAVLSASVGTALIAIVSLKERSREATLMSVRGLSYRQLVWMFISENLATITFAVILGAIVGVIVTYGTITASNAYLNSYSLVTQRLVLPQNAFTVIGTYVALIYASAIGAILVMTIQYVTKLEKMVRTR